MKKLLLVLCGLVAWVQNARAQQFDNPVAIPVSYYGYGVCNYTPPGQYCSFTFGAGSGGYSTANVMNPPPGSQLYSSAAMGYLTPGRNYSVTVTSSNMAFVTVVFAPIDGCDIYINGYKSSSYQAGTNYTFTLRIEKINDLTQSLAKKRGGQCSSFVEDKPIWYVGLGSLRSGKFAGAVGFRQGGPITGSSNLWTTAALVYDTVDATDVSVTRSGGVITRIDAREVTLVMTTLSSTSYKIDVCPQGSTTPFITYTVSQYGSTGLRIDKVENGITWSTALVYSSSSPNWTRYDWQKSSVFPSANITTTTVSGSTSTVTFGSGTGSFTKTKTYTNINGQSELASSQLGSAPSTTYQYYSSSSGSGWAQALQYRIDSTGGWTQYDYFNGSTDTRAGQVNHLYHPWLNSPSTPGSANIANCYVETYDYAANYDGNTNVLASRIVTILGTTAGQSTWAYNWSYATVNSHTIAQVVAKDYASASNYLTTTTLSYLPNDPTTFFQGKPHAVSHPDGTKESYAYYLGTWNATSNSFTVGAGNDRMTLTFHGQASSGTGTTAVSSWNSWTLDTIYLVANLSTIDQTVVDTNGHLVFTGQNIYTGGTSMELIAGTAYAFNGNNLLSNEKDVTRTVATAGGDVSIGYSYSAGLETDRTDVDGSVTHWDYNDQLQNTTATTAYGATGDYPAKPLSYTYFNSGLPNTSQSAPGVTSTYSYDSAGRVTSVAEPGPSGALTTGTAYPSGVQTTVTLPTGATQTTDLYLDGRIKDQTGSGIVDTDYGYAPESGGTGNVVRTIQHGGSSANGWLETTTDWLGRTIIERSFQVGGTAKLRKNYNYSPTTGQLLSVTVKDDSTGTRLLPDHLYVYGNLGLLTQEADDVNANGTIDPASSDRILLYSVSFYKDTGGYNGWIRHDNTQTYYIYGSSSGLATVSDRYTRFTRFNNGGLINTTARVLSDVVTIDPSGRADSTWTWADATNQTQQKYYSVTGVSNAALTTWKNGYLQTDQSLTGVTRTYKYGISSTNGAAQLASVTEGTTNAATTYTYFSGTTYPQTSAVTIGASATATTTFGYSWDTTHNTSTVSSSVTVSGTTYTSYAESNALGLPLHTWGTGVQPSLITYDGYGRKTGLTTYQTDTSGLFTAGTWPTTPPSGNTVTWHLDSATGAVNNKTFADGSHVDFTYTALGKVRTRTWARGVVTTYDYWDGAGGIDLTGELRQVSYSDTTPAWSVSRTRWGAPMGVTDAAGNRTLNYRSDLQLANEALGGFYGSKTLTSNYDTYGRYTGYSFNGSATITGTVGFDSATGRPNSIAGTSGSASVTFSLGYSSGTDWVNSATSGNYTRSTPLVANSGGKYDVLANATTSWSGTTKAQFTAAYNDARGYRTEQDIAGGNDYATNLTIGSTLNTTYSYDGYGQLLGSNGSFGSRTFAWTYDLAGNRTTDTSNGIGTTYTPDNLNRYSSITGGTGSLQEPGLTNDADGNITQDGTWTYAYDGENRLNSMSKTGTTITFLYDYLGRRISKRVNGIVTATFLYQGWTLAAQMDNTGYGIQKKFVWGPDFSDAHSSAGGAGALLAQIDSSSAISYAVPDSYGNIVGYLDSSGNLTAATEFTAYGRALNTYYASGYSSISYPIGYSGQYTDPETNLVYYGMRYYNPKHGRFINRDPIEEAGGNNLFAFVGNGPTRGWDSLGCDPPMPVADQNGVVSSAAAAQYTQQLEAYWEQTHFGMNSPGGTNAEELAAISEQQSSIWVTVYDPGYEYNSLLDHIGVGTIADPRTGAIITLDMAANYVPVPKLKPDGTIVHDYVNPETGDTIPAGQTSSRSKSTAPNSGMVTPGTPLTLEQARVQATLAALSVSEKQKWEYRAWYYMNSDGTYSFLAPTRAPNYNGGDVTEPELPDGATAVGYAHSHSIGDYQTYFNSYTPSAGASRWTPQEWSEHQEGFSGADVAFAAQYRGDDLRGGYEIALGTPSGQLLYYTPDAARSALREGYDPEAVYPGVVVPGAPTPGQVRSIIKGP